MSVTPEQVIEAARKRWPEATGVAVSCGDLDWHAEFGFHICAPNVEVTQDNAGVLFFFGTASLAGILKKIEAHDERN